jgi:hypothetical protein
VKRLALQPCVHRKKVMHGNIRTAAVAAPLHLDARQNAFTLGKTPGKTHCGNFSKLEKNPKI